MGSTSRMRTVTDRSCNNDPATPDVRDGPDNDYWDHVDFVVNQAGALGMYIGFLPTWGDKWNIKRGAGPEIFTPQNAEVYGAWLGRRYRNTPNIVWILGGDRPIDTDTHKEIIRAMARGLRAGDGGAHLMTFHPPGANSSSTWLHDEPWLDFNMRQNGHARGVHRPLRPDARRLRPHANQAGARRRADLRGSSGLVRRQEARALDIERRQAAALLGPLQRRVRPHLRPPLGVADVDAGAATHQQSSAAVARGHRSARRGADAARPRAHRVASLPHANSRSGHHRDRIACRRACPERDAISSRPRATPAAAMRWSMRRWAGRSACA